MPRSRALRETAELTAALHGLVWEIAQFTGELVEQGFGEFP